MVKANHIYQNTERKKIENRFLERYHTNTLIPDSLRPRLLTFRRRIVRALCVRACVCERVCGECMVVCAYIPFSIFSNACEYVCL